MAQYRNIVLADSPIAYYRLGEYWTNGGTELAKTRDESTNWYDAVRSGGITGGVPGAIRSAYNSMTFDGSTGYITAATSGLPFGTAHWSIEAWGYTTNAASVSTQTLFAFGSVGASQLVALQFTNSGTGCFAQLNISGATAAGAAGSISSNQWYHLVGTYDGTHITLYTNGVQTAQTAASPNIILNFCDIGAVSGPANFFIGSVDECAIYSTTLSLSQVATHYSRGTATDAVINYPTTILANAPLCYYRLEETSGTTTKDQGSLGNNGTLHGTITLAQPGAVANDPDYAMSFDGTDDYITMPSAFAPSGYTALSVECWVKFTSLPGSGLPRLVASDLPQTTHNGFDLGCNGTSGNIFWNVGNGTTYASNSNATLTAGAWHHIVGTWDGSNLRIYLDGSVVGSPIALSGTMGTPGFQTNFARNPQTGTNLLPGLLDEIAIYNYTLSASQVSTHYRAGTNSTIGPYSVTIGRGAPVMVDSRTLSIDSTVGMRSQAQFTVKQAYGVYGTGTYGSGYYGSGALTYYQQYQQVAIYDHNCVLQFSGYIATTKEYKPGFQTSLYTQIVCMDQHFLADKRIIYDTVNNHALVYSATAISSAVTNIQSIFLSTEGVTVGNIATMATTRDMTFNLPNAAQAYDALATAASSADGTNNWYWYIDKHLQLFFQSYNTTANNVIVDGTQIEQDLRPPYAIRANPLYANRAFVVYASATTSPNFASYSNTAEFTNQKALDGTGTGQVEMVVKDTSVGAGDAATEAQDRVFRLAQRGTAFVFTSRTGGFAPGQQITVTYSPFNFSSTAMLVENVHADDQLDGYNIWYTVTAVVGPYDTTWVQFFGGLITPQQAGSLNVGV